MVLGDRSLTSKCRQVSSEASLLGYFLSSHVFPSEPIYVLISSLYDTSYNELVCELVTQLCQTLCIASPWTIALQAPLFMEFSSQKYWSGQSFSSPGDLPNPGIEPGSPVSQKDSLLYEPPGKPKGTP